MASLLPSQRRVPVKRARGVSMIRALSFGALCLPALALAQQRPAIVEQVARAYGFDSWKQVEAVRYEFHLDAGKAFQIHRKWIWEPKSDTITYEGPDKAGKPTKVTYTRAQLASQDAFVKEVVDPGFFNDQYWLLFPFHMIWDTGATIEDAGMQKLPIGKGKARKVVVKYPSSGGYLPGDTWAILVGTDNRIKELEFHHGGNAKPAVVVATWEGYKKARPILFSTEHRGKADGVPFKEHLKNIAVKLTGSTDWMEAK
jgi:hypothetical protein